MTVLLIAGDQVPTTPLVDVVGNGGNISPEQIGPTRLKVGTIFGKTVTVQLKGIAHCPVFGTNVYVVVALPLGAGVHTPTTPLFEVVGKFGKAVPKQIPGKILNVGVSLGLTAIVKVAVNAH